MADLEIELSAVSNMNTQLTTDLKSASSKIGNYKRVNRRDKEQEKGLIGRTLFDNVQGVIDQAMKRLLRKKNRGFVSKSSTAVRFMVTVEFLLLTTYFCKWKREMSCVEDSEGGRFRWACINKFRYRRHIEKYGRFGLLPARGFSSRSTIGNRAAVLEKILDRCVPFEEYTSEGSNANIEFDYDAVLWCALKALGLWDKAVRCGVKIVFTLDYAQYCKT